MRFGHSRRGHRQGSRFALRGFETPRRETSLDLYSTYEFAVPFVTIVISPTKAGASHTHSSALSLRRFQRSRLIVPGIPSDPVRATIPTTRPSVTQGEEVSTIRSLKEFGN